MPKAAPPLSRRKVPYREGQTQNCVNGESLLNTGHLDVELAISKLVEGGSTAHTVTALRKKSTYAAGLPLEVRSHYAHMIPSR